MATAAPRRWSRTASSNADVCPRSSATPSDSPIRIGLTARTGFPTSAPIFTASSTTWASVRRWWRTVQGDSVRANVACHSVTVR
jgi:hypothetical protein